MSAFRVGEIVIAVAHHTNADWWNRMAGQEVTVLGISEPAPVHNCQYKVSLPYPNPINGKLWVWADDISLRKKRPPEQKSAFSFQEIIDLCNDKSITQPSEVENG